ncbi:DUF4878 domain-containing protein [Trujillonella endophytica]|uniref:Uncharacterized protein n=1 Tax=Trujillonella endophytica TaxID=673521 RepID=A0A1H8QVQ4_9ACTN|nr:DUF4878 domain-containing protein [Trujillella endophytica]SEO58008.1 protein of unknown function [Trujillella endophytica]
MFPGQVQLAPQPQYAPTPQQAQGLQGGPLASGFPNYRSPRPSPPWLTGKIVGAVVVVLTIAFAVIGFLIVGGRGANSPEGAVEGFYSSIVDGDTERAHDLLCDQLASQITEGDLEASLSGDSGERGASVEVGEASDTTFEGQEAATVPVTLTSNLGNQATGTVTVVEDKGWRVCEINVS